MAIYNFLVPQIGILRWLLNIHYSEYSLIIELNGLHIASWNYVISQMDFRIWKIIISIFAFGKLLYNSTNGFSNWEIVMELHKWILELGNYYGITQFFTFGKFLFQFSHLGNYYVIPQMDFRIWKIIISIFAFGKLLCNFINGFSHLENYYFNFRIWEIIM